MRRSTSSSTRLPAPTVPRAVTTAMNGSLTRTCCWSASGRPGNAADSASFMLGQKQESQHAQHGEAERGFLAVPGRRLPHEEILSTDSLKPCQPQQHAKRECHDSYRLGAREFLGIISGGEHPEDRDPRK